MFEQASAARSAKIKAEREAKAETVTIIESREVERTPSPSSGLRPADPEQARDAAAGPERGGAGGEQVAKLNHAEQAALAQIMGRIDAQQEHGQDLER